MTPVRTIDTDDHTTRKTLWRLHDGTLLESVLMRYPERNTLCISSQAGCGMALPVLRDGAGRPRPQPVDRRDRRSGPLRGAHPARR